jgi:hypothetical protein
MFQALMNVLVMEVSVVTDTDALTMMNVPMATITVMMMLHALTMMVVSHVHVTPDILVKVTMMTALISTNVPLMPTNVTMLPLVPIPSVHTNVNAWPVMKELGAIALTSMNVLLVHTLVLVK